MRGEETEDQEMSGDDLAMAQKCRLQYLRVPFVTADEFEAGLDSERWAIVDVRPEWERRISSIPGAFSLETFESCIDMYRTRKILTVCTVGCRSAAYARQLRAEGLSAYSLYGGLLAWTLQGRTAVDEHGRPTRSVAVPKGF